MTRSRLALASLLAFGLLTAACDGGAAPTAVPPVAASPTAVAVAPPTVAGGITPPAQPIPEPTNTIALGAVSSDQFTIVGSEPTAAPVMMPLADMAQGQANNERAELEAYFKLFYEARTLKPGGGFDFATINNLTAPPYRDYTVSLLQKSQAEADAGKLLEVRYSDIAVEIFAVPEEVPSDVKVVGVKRTQTQVRSDSKPPPVTSELMFRMRRTTLPAGGVSWQAYDFFNAATGFWISEEVARSLTAAQAEPEIRAFFDRFYAARTLAPGGKFDLATSGQLAQFGYYEYTIPLLEKQQAEADAGKLTSVRYSDLAVKLETWEATGTDHGGIAHVAVTRTSHTVRPGQPADKQTGTYRFRLHRHTGDDGKPFWVAYDFLSPISNKWVSESAGFSGPIPPSGHG